MRRPGGKVAILGGGIAGLSAAWRLSEPGWRDRFESITVYQRGWRLGGKGASSRGVHGRIEEHGLHVWLGSYENAFTLLRECYSELNRVTTDPESPIQTWRDAIAPADNPALAERWGDGWQLWFGTHPPNAGLPGEPGGTGREITAVEFVRRAVQMAMAYLESLRESVPGDLVLSTSPAGPPLPRVDTVEAVQRGLVAAALAVSDPNVPADSATELLEHALEAIRVAIDDGERLDHHRIWTLLSLVVSMVRGIVADHLLTRSGGFDAINDEEFGSWVLRHGGHPDALSSPLVRGLYDLVFGYADADPEKPAVAAGVMTFLTGLVLFGYQGAFFWKMTAGMGDVVIAPLYQALRRRGVEFEFFHRLDALHLDSAHQSVDAITLGRQIACDGRYEPLATVGGLAVFPDAPIADQLRAGGSRNDLESHFGTHDDVDKRVLRRGVDFDHVVLAVSIAMLPVVAAELIDASPDWREMTTHVRTVATQAFQLWLRPDERELGWTRPGATVTAYHRPFETFASMSHTLQTEQWPEHDRPRTVAYFCGSLDAPWPTGDISTYAGRFDEQVRRDAARYVDDHVPVYFPDAADTGGFDWRLVTGMHVSVNIDPSDRYVQSVPGSDKFRLRPDESGYDNLVLAGDWTDNGLNAGCIEAAVMSGLEAANALLGRGRFHRVRGFYLP